MPVLAFLPERFGDRFRIGWLRSWNSVCCLQSRRDISGSSRNVWSDSIGRLDCRLFGKHRAVYTSPLLSVGLVRVLAAWYKPSFGGFIPRSLLNPFCEFRRRSFSSATNSGGSFASVRNLCRFKCNRSRQFVISDAGVRPSRDGIRAWRQHGT